jgi:hypothetical protein
MRVSRLSLVALVFLAVGAIAVPGAASAEPSADAAARVHYDQGRKLAAEGKFREAYVEFEAGYRVSARPAFLFNMGEAARGEGDPARARAAYEKYLAAEPDGSLAATAKQRLAAMGPAPAPAPSTGPRTTVTTSNGTDPGKEPVRLMVDPARHTQVAVTPREHPHPLTLEPRPRSMWKRWPIWAAIGTAVVAGTILAVVASRDEGVTCSAGCIDLRPSP